MSALIKKNLEIPKMDRQIAKIRSDRVRKASLSVMVRYLAMGLSIIVSFVSVPLTLGYLEKERYGLWLTINSLIAYLNVSDLGLGLGLANRVAEARGRNELGVTGRLLGTAVFFLAGVGLTVAVAGIAATWFAPLDTWFHISTNGVTAELRWTLTVVLLTFACLLPTRMIASAQNGFQEAYFGGLWGIAGSLMGLVALLLVIASKGDMASLAFATFFLSQIMNLANMWHFFRIHPEAQPSLRKIDFKLLPHLFSISWQFFVLQIYTVIIWQTDNLVIATQRGADQVVPYAIAFRIMWVPLTLLTSIPGALWPAYTEAKARGDWDWIRSTYRRTTLLTVLIATLSAVIFFAWGQEFILMWAGPGAYGTGWLIAGLSVYLISGQWANCNAILVNAIGRPIQQVYSGFFEATLNLGLSLFLIRFWDLAGVAWGTAFASLFVSNWFLAWSVWHMTEKRVSPPWLEILKIALLPGAVSGAVGMWLQTFIPITWPSLLRIGVGSSLMTLIFFATACLVSTKEIRDVFPPRASLILSAIHARICTTDTVVKPYSELR